MKRLTVLVALAMMNIAPGWAVGDDATKAAVPGMAGDWEGTLKVTPQISLRITLKVSEGKDGTLAGTWGSPDEGLEGLPLGSIAIKDGALTFTTKHGVTYKGKVNAAGSEVAGEWTQRGKNYPLTFKRYDASKAVAAAPIPKELEGFWEGKIKVNSVIELRLVLQVQKGKDGALKATLASPDQGAKSIPISAIDLKGDMLTFESKIIGSKYSGKKTKEGTGFDGKFTQHGLKLSLALKKTDKLSMAVRPQMPKPPFPYRSEDVQLRKPDRRREAGRHVDLAGGQRAVSGGDDDHGLWPTGPR